MPPVLRAVHKKAEDLLPLGTSSNKPAPSASTKSRIFRLLVVFSTLALFGYLFASAFHNMLLRAQLVPLLQAPPPSAAVIGVPKTLLQLQEEAGEREARQMEEEEAEEQEEEEVSPGDGNVEEEEEDERQDVEVGEPMDDTPEAISAASSELDDDEEDDDIEQQHDLPQEEQDDTLTEDDVTAAAVRPQTMLRSNQDHDDELEIQDSLGPEDRLALEQQQQLQEKPKLDNKPEFNLTAQMLHQRGMGKVVFVYRVVAPHVVVRTQPSPIGALKETAPKGALMGIVKFTSPHGSILIGSHVSQQFGMWLKLAPHVWAPVSKKESVESGFVNQMRLVRKLPIPESLNAYWKQKPVDCSIAAAASGGTTASKSAAAAASKLCEEENAIRNAVLEFLRRNLLIEDPPTKVEEKNT